MNPARMLLTRGFHDQGVPTQRCNLARLFILNLLCPRTADYGAFYAAELTAPQLSDPRVWRWSGAENAGQTKR
jgi:hypothetical protein